MVSVIVPVYNVEEYLDQCIQSIVNQTDPDLEILLLDDGSTDASGEICRQWQKQDSRIIYLCKKNEGQGPTRNMGVCLAKGDVLAFVDSDDWIEPDFIKVMLEAMGDSDMVFCDYYVVKRNQTLVGRRYCTVSQPCSLSNNTRLLFAMGAATWNKLYRRDWWVRTKILQPSYAYEDVSAMPALWIQAGKIAQVTRPLYHYRIDREQSTTNDLLKISDIFRALSNVVNSFEQLNLRDKYRFYLDKYCAMVLSVPLARVKNNPIERQKLMTYFYENFSDAKQIDTMRVLILGSMHGEYAVAKASFLREDFERIDWTQDWQEALINTDVDLIIMDLAGDILPDVDVLLQLLRQFPGKVCILDGTWTPGWGLYSSSEPYEQIQAIDTHNRMVADYCDRLRSFLPDAVWLSCGGFNYTDAEFPLGVAPMYRNNYYYYSIAEQLWAVVRSFPWIK